MLTLAQVNALLEARIDRLIDSPTGLIAFRDGLAYRIEFRTPVPLLGETRQFLHLGRPQDRTGSPRPDWLNSELVWLDTPSS
ncbi:MAG: hypothetical protein D6728_07510 [Cyanobacteria bacterium J055]|nr:MAG: hypothetical protein D6728_07510 [Cyanobacteria bacterium J055]